MLHICTHPAHPHLVCPAIYAAPSTMTYVSPASNAASSDGRLGGGERVGESVRAGGLGDGREPIRARARGRGPFMCHKRAKSADCTASRSAATALLPHAAVIQISP